MTTGSWWRCLLALLGSLFVVMATAPSAGAHARIELVSPPDGGRSMTAPRTLVIYIGEAVRASDVHVRLVGARSTTSYELGQVTPQDAGLFEVDVVDPIQEESLLLEVSTVGLDGHPTTASFGFVVGDGPYTSVTGATTDAGPPDAAGVAFGIARSVGIAALAVLAAPFSLMIAWRDGLRHRFLERAIGIALLVCVVTTMVELVAWSAQLQGTRLPAWTPGHLAAALGLPAGKLMLARLVAAVIVVASLRSIIRRERARTRAPGWRTLP